MGGSCFLLGDLAARRKRLVFGGRQAGGCGDCRGCGDWPHPYSCAFDAARVKCRQRGVSLGAAESEFDGSEVAFRASAQPLAPRPAPRPAKDAHNKHAHTHSTRRNLCRSAESGAAPDAMMRIWAAEAE